jgi:hypothetical protein
MKKFILAAMLLVSVFIMCGGCHRHGHRNSERPDRDRASESRHDERR